MTESVLSKNPCIVGLYAVAPDLEDTNLLARLVGAALEGGAMLVQYRNKVASDSLRAEQAARLAVLCAKHGRPLIINDHVELALSIRAAGLHVGTDDIGDLEALCALRRRLGSSRILGVSCYCSLDRACEAAVACADYAAFGSIFPSTTKPGAPPAALDVFTEARAIGIALVGIGGITHDNVAALINAGADAAAVISDLFAIHDEASVLARARALTAVFKTR